MKNLKEKNILVPVNLHTLGSQGLTLPLQNRIKKRIMFFNTLGCSDKEFESGFSKNVWAFFQSTDCCFPYGKP